MIIFIERFAGIDKVMQIAKCAKRRILDYKLSYYADV